MSYTSTTNLSLRKDNGDEKIVDMRPHLNTNLDVIDQAYGDLNSRYRGQQTWGGLKGTATWGELKGNDVSTASAQTTNLQLIKPGYDSEVDVDVFNDNMDIIDSSIKSLQDSVALAKSATSSPISLNGTWQIPSGLMSHKFILLMLGRYGRYGTNVVSVDEIKNGTVNEPTGSLVFPEGSFGSSWRICISKTGLITLVRMVDTSNAPNILAYAFL